ncbi:hypothetical protein GN244_ATG15010 [Phytophthora infestans]|uniref:Uncharacterized protein n=1 Tax=Phytophthora infestans TaxID=4787 RepID=A0A833W808_PHYIN|nr:hypothetical protein GN244_ATG15010 [Phytophthora infestans]
MLVGPRFASHIDEGSPQSKTVVGACLLLPNKLNFRIKFSERSKKKELKAVFFSSFKLTHLPERIGCDLDGRRQKMKASKWQRRRCRGAFVYFDT